MARQWRLFPGAVQFCEAVRRYEKIVVRMENCWRFCQRAGSEPRVKDEVMRALDQRALCREFIRPQAFPIVETAGSLNRHLGMHEMNMRTDEEFVAFAVKCGNDPAYRSAICEKLERQKRESGLFDMQGYAKDFFELLTRIAAHRRTGGVPANFPSDISSATYPVRPASSG